MIKPMTDEEAKRAIERAKANRFDEAGNYGENNGPLPKMTEQEALEAAWDAYIKAEETAWADYLKEMAKIEEEYKDD